MADVTGDDALNQPTVHLAAAHLLFRKAQGADRQAGRQSDLTWSRPGPAEV